MGGNLLQSWVNLTIVVETATDIGVIGHQLEVGFFAPSPLQDLTLLVLLHTLVHYKLGKNCSQQRRRRKKKLICTSPDA